MEICVNFSFLFQMAILAEKKIGDEKQESSSEEESDVDSDEVPGDDFELGEGGTNDMPLQEVDEQRMNDMPPVLVQHPREYWGVPANAGTRPRPRAERLL